jgi:hypothetical protein
LLTRHLNETFWSRFNIVSENKGAMPPPRPGSAGPFSLSILSRTP